MTIDTPTGRDARSAGALDRARRWLRGRDRVDGAPLPIGEALHPLVLAAAALLVLNDWWLKPSAAPGWLTGKLSDLAGLVLAPLVLSALVGVVLHLAARAGARLDPSLSRARLGACVGATGLVFTVAKVVPAAADRLGAAWAVLSPGATVVADPTDLLALPALVLAWRLGQGELRRVPLGRTAALRRLGRPAAPALADVLQAGATPARIAALAAALDAGNDREVSEQLRALA